MMSESSLLHCCEPQLPQNLKIHDFGYFPKKNPLNIRKYENAKIEKEMALTFQDFDFLT